MGTKTIGLDEEAYERLRAEKREDESFSDVVKRVTGVVSADWRRSFGKYGDSGAELEQAARASRERRGTGLTARQDRTIAAIGGDDAGGRSDDTTEAGDTDVDTTESEET
jgi:predicted CopG family antitoxin